MATKKGKQKRVPPSRVRYEATHPTISVRISQEFRQELEELREMSGLSMADILRAGLDKLQPDIVEIFEKGFSEGYEAAEEEFKVMAPCGACGKAHLPVTGERMKSVAAQRLIGWSAKGCR